MQIIIGVIFSILLVFRCIAFYRRTIYGFTKSNINIFKRFFIIRRTLKPISEYLKVKFVLTV